MQRIDLSDLAGSYTLDQIPTVIEKIQQRVERCKNQISVKEVGFSERLKNSLLRADIYTLQECCYFTKKEILGFDGLGEASFVELKQMLDKHGLKLKTNKK